ncbi:MAG: diphosphomevalonate decarboxylase [Bacteroidota bacterium]
MLNKKYRDEAILMEKDEVSETPKVVAWESPSNIALIKYWGKKGNQLPLTPSLSMTLSNSNTRTEIHFRKAEGENGTVSFHFNGEAEHPFVKRVKKYIRRIEPYFPFLKYMDLYIISRNTFPHSAGLASSASAMSSLALCICSIETMVRKEEFSSERFFQKASFMARLGSGSASRSVYGNFVEWGRHAFGADEFAYPSSVKIHHELNFIHDSILITSSAEKPVSSSKGHSLMKNHPFKEARIKQSVENLDQLRKALREGNFESFAEIIENEALTLHGLMLSSKPGYILLNDQTVSIIEKIRNYRKKNNTKITFTLDAGPNVHVLYPLSNKEEARNFIEKELKMHCEDGKIIHDFIGTGPERVDKNNDS